MPDIDKVIKGLTLCSDIEHYAQNCGKCPYKSKLTDLMCFNMLKDALELLKEQEAKPVEVCGQMFTVKYGHCPTCGKGMDSDTYPHWCGFCGQAVKWE